MSQMHHNARSRDASKALVEFMFPIWHQLTWQIPIDDCFDTLLSPSHAADRCKPERLAIFVLSRASKAASEHGKIDIYDPDEWTLETHKAIDKFIRQAMLQVHPDKVMSMDAATRDVCKELTHQIVRFKDLISSILHNGFPPVPVVPVYIQAKREFRKLARCETIIIRQDFEDVLVSFRNIMYAPALAPALLVHSAKPAPAPTPPAKPAPVPLPSAQPAKPQAKPAPAPTARRGDELPFPIAISPFAPHERSIRIVANAANAAKPLAPFAANRGVYSRAPSAKETAKEAAKKLGRPAKVDKASKSSKVGKSKMAPKAAPPSPTRKRSDEFLATLGDRFPGLTRSDIKCVSVIVDRLLEFCTKSKRRAKNMVDRGQHKFDFDSDTLNKCIDGHEQCRDAVMAWISAVENPAEIPAIKYGKVSKDEQDCKDKFVTHSLRMRESGSKSSTTLRSCDACVEWFNGHRLDFKLFGMKFGRTDLFGCLLEGNAKGKGRVFDWFKFEWVGKGPKDKATKKNS